MAIPASQSENTVTAQTGSPGIPSSNPSTAPQQPAPGMGGPTPPVGMSPGAAPMGIPQPAMAAARPQGAPNMPMDPMIPPHVRAMMPRPYPNPQQMFQPVGLAAVMQMQMMQQQMSTQKTPPTKKK
jgi:hypothetical protein